MKARSPWFPIAALSFLTTGFPATFPECRAEQPIYSIQDLGTLGGDFSRAGGLNNSGQVVGSSTNQDRTLRAFLFTSGLMQDLGFQGDFYQNAINSRGDVAVNSSAFYLYRAGQATNLGFGGTGLAGINESGAIAGTRYGPGGHPLAFVYSGSGLKDMSLGGSFGSFAIALNNTGTVVGQAYVGENSSTRHPFVYRSGSIEDLGTFGGTDGAAMDVNNTDQVVGFATNAQELQRAFILSNGVKHDLGSLYDHVEGQVAVLGNSGAQFITDSGDIVGWTDALVPGDDSDPSARTEQHVFLYSNGGMKDIGTLGGDRSYATDVNERGWVVGGSLTSDSLNHPFLYRDGTIYDLHDLVPEGSQWTLDAANLYINSTGQIAGSGSIAGEPHAFLMTPVPEPATRAAILAGLGVLLVAARMQRKGAGAPA